MKKFAKMALLLLLIVASVCMFTACDNESNTDNAVGEISVAESGMPQLVFVRGEQLDLSNGVLTVKNGDEVKEISMTAEGVTVTGYDTNKLGEQTITITYGGKSTELKITVVERMQVLGQTTEYLVGDKLDSANGRLQITRNDGSNYTMLLGSTGVEIVGYDANKTGSQTLTVKYTANDATYECKFDINVYAIENVEFIAPTKTNYNSHESGLDLTNGYFVLTGNGGNLTKNVALEESMVKNFDLTAVNEENSPLKQNLSVTYNGKDYSYEITLTYSTISKFLKEAGAFNIYDWSTNEIPVIDDAMGQKALELMEAFLDLSKAEQNCISYTDTMNVARAALLYGMARMDPEMIALEGAFVISGGSLEFTCETLEGVKQAIEILDNDDSELYRISPIIVGMVELFETEQVLPDMYFGDFGMLPNEIYVELLEILEHMVDAYDALAEIPEDWQTVGVNTYAAEIENFYDIMFSNDFVDGGMAYIYGYVSNWRTTGDAFDILYHYYYGNGDAQAMNNLAKVNLPTCLSEIAYHLIEMISQTEMIANQQAFDSSLMLYHYYTALRLIDELKAGDDEMAKNLYDALPVNSLLGVSDSQLFSFDTLVEYVKTMSGGYYEYCGGMLGKEAFHNVLNAYLAWMTNILEDDSYEYSERYNADLEEIFALFIDMKPTEQYYFLNTLNAYYSMNVPPLVFDDTGDYALLMTLFTRRLHEYYRGNLGNGATAYNELILAIEIYANRVSRGGWVEEFNERMDRVDAAYEAMTADEKAAFDRYLGEAYAKYNDIRNRFVNIETYTDMGEWENMFKDLDDAILNVEIAVSYLNKGADVYSLFLSAYERAQNIEAYILKNAPAEILEMYYYEDRIGLDENGQKPDGAVLYSYEYIMNTYRSMYITLLLTAPGYSIYDQYLESDLRTFLDATYDVTWLYNHNTEENPLTYDKAKVLNAMKLFREMHVTQQVLFVSLEGNQGMYYTALSEFMNTHFTAAAAALGEKLLEMEQAYILYGYSGDASSLDSLADYYDQVTAMYAALSAEDLASFAELEDLYNFYVGAYEAIVENAA